LTVGRCWIAIWFLLAFATSSSAENCTDIERRLEVRVRSLAVARDQLGVFRGLGETALTGLKNCPDSVKLWYFAARSAEVLEVPFAGAAFSGDGGAKKIARDAIAHVANSAPLVTILARIDGTAASARRAHEIDPGYRPARRVLAIALAKEGAISEALQILDLPDLSSADRIARARALLAAGHAEAAVSEAKKSLDQPLTDPAEPTPEVELFRNGNEVLGFALLAAGRTKDALRVLRSAATVGSRAAQLELDKRR
jgi:hypothetical protein